MKPLLTQLSTALLKLHRELLHFQAHRAGKDDQREYAPYDLLKLSMTDPRFTWLRQFSDLIIQIDIITDDKKNTPYDAHSLVISVKKALTIDSSQPPELIRALQADSSLMISLGLAKKALLTLETELQAQSN